jgi:chemotaxis signal transduction protein
MKRLAARPAVGIDWSAGHADLTRGAAAWSEALSPSPERTRRILDERARLLAHVPAQASATRSSDVVVFARGRGRFAIEARFVHEVFRPGEIVPLPGAPAFVHGVANFRGEFLVLIDLCRVLGLGEPGAAPVHDALALGEDDVAFGVVADEVLAVTSLAADTLHDPRTTLNAAASSAIRGITADGLVMLDGGVLLADRRLFTRESAATAPLPAGRGINP